MRGITAVSAAVQLMLMAHPAASENLFCVKIGSDLTLHDLGRPCNSGEGVDLSRLHEPGYVESLPKEFRYGSTETYTSSPTGGNLSQCIAEKWPQCTAGTSGDTTIPTYIQVIVPLDDLPKPGKLFRVTQDGKMERVDTKWHLRDGKLYLGDTGIYIAYGENPISPYTLHYGDRPDVSYHDLNTLKGFGEKAAEERAEFGK